MNETASSFTVPVGSQALIVGASRGIGLGFVQALLRQAELKTLWATYRNPDTAEDLRALERKYPALHCLQLDITDETQIQETSQRIQHQTPQLHLVINCVGILHEEPLQPEKSLRQLDTAQLLRYFQVNSIGAVLLAKHLLPLLCHADRNLFATLSAKLGSIEDNYLGGWYGYRASKAALNMFLRTAAIEYARKSPQTILVTLHPGTTDTQLTQPFQKTVPPEKLFAVERTVSQLLNVLAGLDNEDSGKFFNWDGQALPW